MNNNYPQIQELLHQKADYQARLNLLPYDGTPEVKESGGNKYLYIRKRVGSRLSSKCLSVVLPIDFSSSATLICTKYSNRDGVQCNLSYFICPEPYCQQFFA